VTTAGAGRWPTGCSASRPTAREYRLIDLIAFDLPVFSDAALPAKMGKKYADERVQRFSDELDACDGYVFITAEYNHGIPGAFKNAIDHVGPELFGKPLAFVSYGAASGVRAVEQWRQVAANFNMFDIRNQVSMSTFTEFDGETVAPSERRTGELGQLFDTLVPIAAKLSA